MSRNRRARFRSGPASSRRAIWRCRQRALSAAGVAGQPTPGPAGKTPARRAPPRNAGSTSTGWLVEVDGRNCRRLLVDGELRHLLGIGIEQPGPETPREGRELGVVLLDRADVVAPRHGDAVLRSLELGLQGLIVRVGLEFGVLLRLHEQAGRSRGGGRL